LHVLWAAGITAPWLAVPERLADHPYLSADQVTTAVRPRLGTISGRSLAHLAGAVCRLCGHVRP